MSKAMRQFRGWALVTVLAVCLAISGCAPAPDAGQTGQPPRAAGKGIQMAAKVHRDGNRVWLESIDKFLPYQQNTVINCYATAMRALGEDCTYEYLMGVSGAAFRFQLSQGQWCGSSPHAYCGFNCGKVAADALPYEIVSCGLDDANTAGRSRAAVVASIDAGVPAVASSEESALVVGYADGGAVLLRRTVWGDSNRPPEAWKGNPWGFGVFRPRPASARPDRKQLVRKSLRQAVEIATAIRFGGGGDEKSVTYDAGTLAMLRWVQELRMDDAAFARLDPNLYSQQMNAWIYHGLCDARGAAAGYLKAVAGDLAGQQKAHVLKAAELYGQVYAALSEKCPLEVAPYPGPGVKWDAASRAVQARLLEKAIPLEEKAIRELQYAVED
jgi:hypothetical protein